MRSLHNAAKDGDLETVKAWLKDNPDLVFSKDVYDETPLHSASYNGHKDVTELLLANKADVNAKNKYNVTPLQVAVVNGHKDVVELLLVNKADVNAKNKYATTPLRLAELERHKEVAELLRQHGGISMGIEGPLIDVSVYLRGDRLQPEHVTQVLGVQPTKVQTKGGFLSSSTKGIAKIGFWAICVHIDSTNISDHIDEMLKKIGNQKIPLNKIEGVEEAYLDIFVAKNEYKEEKYGDPLEFRISKGQLTELVKLGLSIEISVS